MSNEEVKQFISQQIPETVFEESQFLNAIIEAPKAYALLKTLRENPDTEFDYLFCESGVDWKDFYFSIVRVILDSPR